MFRSWYCNFYLSTYSKRFWCGRGTARNHNLLLCFNCDSYHRIDRVYGSTQSHDGIFGPEISGLTKYVWFSSFTYNRNVYHCLDVFNIFSNFSNAFYEFGMFLLVHTTFIYLHFDAHFPANSNFKCYGNSCARLCVGCMGIEKVLTDVGFWNHGSLHGTWYVHLQHHAAV